MNEVTVQKREAPVHGLFGGTGKLGHGNMNRYSKPRVIEALSGLHIRKVACTGQSSLALTSAGQVCLKTGLFLQVCIVLKAMYRLCM